MYSGIFGGVYATDAGVAGYGAGFGGFAGGGDEVADLAMAVSPGFLLLTAFLYYVGGGGAVIAFLSAALAHELGHLTAMWALKAEITSLRLTPCGPVIGYRGDLTNRQEMCILAAGPMAGIFFALLCFFLDTEYFSYVGAIALLAAFFNLLPVEPMDGGRLLRLLLEEVLPDRFSAVILRICGNVCAAGVILTGIWTGSLAAAGAGIWMAALANMPHLR